jgi:hypothetical protein
MSKTITIDSIATPDMPPYHDRITVVDSGAMLFSGECSATPNAFRPSDRLPWDKCYAWIAPGHYTAIAGYSEKYGLHLRVNGGARVPTRNANINQNGEFIADGILIHCGDSATWQGSKGCITLPPDSWGNFIKLFKLGDVAILIINDAIKGDATT